MVRDEVNNPGLPSWLSLGNQFRCNPLTGHMIQVSTERLSRAWGGEVSQPPEEKIPKHDPDCPFCPGNKRAGGRISPTNIGDYPYAFVNDTQALNPHAIDDPPVTYEDYRDPTGLYHAIPAYGECEVIIHHPDHSRTLSTVPESHAVSVFRLWADRYRALGEEPYISTVNIFENFLFGSSMRHPHNQLWAPSIVPPIQQTILANLSTYRKEKNDYLLQVIVREERRIRERVVFENTDFICIVPFWAEWPFEMMIIPRTARNSLLDLNETELENFTDAYRRAINRLNNLFGIDCPYSTGLYQAPTDGGRHDEGMFHLMFRPPVLRDIRTKKWMVGYELMAMIQRDLTPEAAAFLLRNPQGWEDFKDEFVHHKSSSG